MTDAARALSNCKKKRGVVKASITRLASRVDDVEHSSNVEDARRLTARLDSLVAEFKVHHYSIIDLLDKEDELEVQQEILDQHDDHVSQLAARLEKIVATGSSIDSSQPRIAVKRLKNIEKGLSAILTGASSLPSGDDRICLIQQYEEKLSELKSEFSDIRRSLLSFDIEDSSQLGVLLARVEASIFDSSVTIKKLLRASSPSSSSLSDITGVKLPKLDVPTFDGNILNWTTFWEQFGVSVHGRSNLADSEKLAYLRHALKGGSAKSVIEGLSRSGDHYNEAITCLKSRYDRPRLIHQAHVQKILEVPNLKEGTGKELRRLYDTAQQHLRALKALGHEPSGSFITSLLELKFDVNTMFEWQRHSQSSADVPHYKDLLEFIDLRAQASEASLSDSSKKPSRNDPGSSRKSLSSVRNVTSFAASADTSSNCVLCKSEKHPLYACSKFKSLPHDNKMSTLKSNGLCLNCLRSGHFMKNCSSHHRCRVCQKRHHTLLHLEEKPHVESSVTPVNPASSVPVPAAPITSSHATTGIKSNLLLMTCQVKVEAPDGSSMQARAILDSGSSASFISERLAQSLRLPRSSQSTKISGVAGFVRNSVQPVTTFQVFSTHSPTKKFVVSAVVVPRVTCDLPLHPIPFNQGWSHLSGLQLADPSYGQPGRVDLLLGIEVFAEVAGGLVHLDHLLPLNHSLVGFSLEVQLLVLLSR